MSDLAKLGIWDDPAIFDALSGYLDVAENRRPAKFRIAATVAAGLDPAAESEDALWAELERLTPLFLARWRAIRAGARLPPASDGPSLLELCRELAYRMLGHCNFCPWNCRVDRVGGAKFGACKLASGSRVSSHFHHMGEELFYRGTEGSGTIFFTSCNMRGAFGQNGDISTDKDNGEETDPRTLASMAWTLRREGCHNINWVGGEVVIHLHASLTLSPSWAATSRRRRRSWLAQVRRRPTASGSSTTSPRQLFLTERSTHRCSGTATSS
jgi:putative pyruvate formate lyase activating enzyme